MSAGDFLHKHVLHNIGLKLTSLLLAAALWLAIASSPQSQVDLNVPIIFLNMPPELQISSENIPTAQVRVRGPERMVRHLQASDLRIEVDLSDTQPGERTFDLARDVAVPDHLRVSQVVPGELHLAFDTRDRRQVPVHPRIVGTPAAGYRVGEIQCDPATVDIMGPRKKVALVESALTDPVDVQGAVDTITASRPAYVPDALVQVSDPHLIRITVTMQKGTSSPVK